MPSVGSGDRAIAAIKPTVVRIGISFNTTCCSSLRSSRVANAMRPCVIAAERDATRGAPLNRKKQTVVAGSTPGVHLLNNSKILAGHRICETQPAALVGIACCRASGVLDAGQCARSQSQKDSGIDVFRRPEMRGLISKITRRNEPIGSDLFLKAQVPLNDLHVRCVVIRRQNERVLRPYRVVLTKALPVRKREWISARLGCPGI